MTRFFRKTFCIASLGIVVFPAPLLADDNFILQPKIQPVIVAITEADPDVEPSAVSENSLVLQPSKPETLTPPVATKPSEIPTASQLPRVAPTQQVAQPTMSDFGDPLKPESANGLVWVKRGSQSALVSAIAKNPEPNLILPDVPSLTKRPTPTVETQIQPSIPAKTVSSVVPNQENSTAPVAMVSASNTRARAQLASKISKKILEEGSTPKQYLSGGSSLMGPAAIEQELTLSLSRSEQLCRRGVFLSARDEAKSAELQLARYLDSISNTFQSEPRLQAARIAMREAGDFSKETASKILPELISAHETPVLKDVVVQGVSPSVLKQSYYQYAESMLLEGAQQHPWFSDIFYSLGRTFQAEADSSNSDAKETLRAQAVVYYRAASAIRPNNAMATNQLGYVLLQLDRPADAMQWLIPSVDAKLDLPALQNLAEASRRVGDRSMQQWAMSQIEQIRRQNPQVNSRTPDILELNNSAFAATTPIVPFSSTNEHRTANIPNGNLR